MTAQLRGNACSNRANLLIQLQLRACICTIYFSVGHYIPLCRGINDNAPALGNTPEHGGGEIIVIFSPPLRESNDIGHIPYGKS